MTNVFPYVALADDDPDDRELFCSAMNCHYPQFIVRLFKDGDDLLSFLATCTPANLPTCIVIDYKMPRMSAPQFLHLTDPETCYGCIPKIVWSSSHRHKDRDECLSLGAVGFVVKPDSELLLKKMMDALEEWLIKGTMI